VRVVVDGLPGKVPDTERDVLSVVLDNPGRYVDAVGDLFTVTASVDVLALSQRVHQTIQQVTNIYIHRESKRDLYTFAHNFGRC